MSDRSKQDEANFKEWKEWMKKHETDYYKKRPEDCYPSGQEGLFRDGPIDPTNDCAIFCPCCKKRLWLTSRESNPWPTNS